MESDKRYFIEGLFVIGFTVALALFFVWLQRSSDKNDVLYRIHFSESVSGLVMDDPVKFLGVDVGMVKNMSIDPDNPRQVRIDVLLHKGTPIKTDTKASLQFKGITGAYFIELDGGSADAKLLADVTPAGQIPEITSKKSSISTLMEQLPRIVEKFSSLENQAGKVVADIGEVTAKVKENPSLLLRRPKKDKDKDKKSDSKDDGK
ncbi:MAG: MlaD family protein [Arenimonas sp.]